MGISHYPGVRGESRGRLDQRCRRRGSYMTVAEKTLASPEKKLARRLYVLVRGDLPAGLQLAQACHVARLFTKEHPDVELLEDENLVALSVATEEELLRLGGEGSQHGPSSTFREPDLEGAATAVALGGDLLGRREIARLLSALPLALRA